MQLPTNLAVSFLQLADRNGVNDGKVSQQELANMVVSYYDEYNKQKQAGNTQLADSYKPYIEFGLTAFFGGKEKKGLIPDFNGDKSFGIDEALRLDNDKNGVIDVNDYKAVFGDLVAPNGNPIQTSDFDTLRTIAMGQQFSTAGFPVPPATTPAVTPPPTTPGTPTTPTQTDTTGISNLLSNPQQLMATMALVLLMGSLGGNPGALLNQLAQGLGGISTTSGTGTTGSTTSQSQLPPSPYGTTTTQNSTAQQAMMPLMFILMMMGAGGGNMISMLSNMAGGAQGLGGVPNTATVSTNPSNMTGASQIAKQNMSTMSNEYLAG